MVTAQVGDGVMIIKNPGKLLFAFCGTDFSL
jgi:hypothetical protein